MAAAMLLASCPAVAAGRDVVRLDPQAPVVIPAAGRVADATLWFVVRDGYHVQANPASADYLKPAVVELTSACGIAPGKPLYPPAVPYRLEGADSDLATYAHRFKVTIALSTSNAGLKPGDCALHGTLRYQACDARTCLAPATLAFELPVSVR